jgi:hypothetical protein
MAVLTTVSDRLLFGASWPSGVRLATLVLVWIFGGVGFGSFLWKLKQRRAAVNQPAASVESPPSHP